MATRKKKTLPKRKPTKPKAKARKAKRAKTPRKRSGVGRNASFIQAGLLTVLGWVGAFAAGVFSLMSLAGSQIWNALSGNRARQPLAMVLTAFSIYTFVALIDYDGEGNVCGQIGEDFAHNLVIVFGIGAFLAPAFGVFWGIAKFLREQGSGSAIVKLVGVAILTLTASISAQALGAVEPTNAFPYGQGGWLGETLYPPLSVSLGSFGVGLLLVLLGAVSSLLATEWAFVPLFRDLAKKGAAKLQPDLPLSSHRESLREQASQNHKKTVRGFARIFQFFKTFISPFHSKDEQDFLPENAVQTELPLTGGSRPEEKPELEVEMPGSGPQAKPQANKPESDETAEDPPEAIVEQPSLIEGEAATSRDEPEVLPEPAVPIAADTPVEDAPREPRPEPVLESLPPESILVLGERKDPTALMEEVKLRGADLQKVFDAFALQATVIGAKRGPTLTLFEVQLATGISVKKLKQQRDDIAVSLGVQEGVRVVYPLPGKTTVGVEVPNLERESVTLMDVFQGVETRYKKNKLPSVLGRGTLGDPCVEDLAKMPHMLIAGTTGSGKSVCVNSILTTMLMTRKPHQLRLVLIDPKQVELQLYQDIPHLLCPVVTDMKRAPFALEWAVRQMEDRLHSFKKAGVRNLDDYNSLGATELKKRIGDEYDAEDYPKSMPYIVIVIDELADLMIQARKEVEMAIARIAAKARAAGLHMIVATQRPSTDVVTGLIKTNMPVRMAFRVASGIDSRVILDDSGAEVLLGNGDFLYRPPGTASLVRGQGCFVSEEEVRQICDHLRSHGKPEFLEELVAGPQGAQGGGAVDDPLFGDAVRVILRSGRGSASLLQRALSVGYTRGSRLVDIMTEQGILGPHCGSKSREILVTLEEFEERFPEYAESN